MIHIKDNTPSTHYKILYKLQNSPFHVMSKNSDEKAFAIFLVCLTFSIKSPTVLSFQSAETYLNH